jgi:hypothetical protein
LWIRFIANQQYLSSCSFRTVFAESKEDEAIQLEQEIMSEDEVKDGKYLYT